MKLVISLGGSVIVPNQIDVDFLKKFKRAIDKIRKGNKIVIVTGGGSTARKYIEVLRREGRVERKTLGYLGYRITKINALLLGGFLNVKVADTMKEVKRLIKTNNLIVCGALNFNVNGTSDWTASEIGRDIKADLFVNITNVKGLYDKNPKKYKDAKFIPEISFKDFEKKANEIKFKVGQHFVLDQRAAVLISKYKIRTIITKDVKNLERIVKGGRTTGTIIDG